MMWSDSHAHLTADGVQPELDAILARAKEAGVSRIINICTGPKTLERGVTLAVQIPWIANTAATTPHDVEAEGESFFPLVEQAAERGDLVAIGETGLDYYYEHAPRDLQKTFLRRYLALARKHALPVVIHCRDAFPDFFSIIDKEYMEEGRHLPGILHCFTGTLDEAREVIARGWMLSLSGIVTFQRSDVLREVAAVVPLDQLLIETDTPYLAPVPYRGKPNEPAYLPETGACIAAVRGISPQELAQATAANLERILKRKTG